jgi:hypothetical protein
MGKKTKLELERELKDLKNKTFEDLEKKAEELGLVLITEREADHYKELKGRRWRGDSSFLRMG